MKTKAIVILRNCLIAFLLVVVGLAAANPAQRSVYASTGTFAPLFQGQPADGPPRTYPIMRMTAGQKRAEAELTRRMPAAPFDKAMQLRLQGSTEGAALSLLSHIQYTPSERNQGSAGNCWVWAGTGVLEVALDVQRSIKDRLSIQYFDSNYTPWAGCGGNAYYFGNFYASKLKVIPWSNDNATYQDGSRSCSSGGSLVNKSTISESPSYAITSIGPVQQISTYGVGQAAAIANIKNILDQNKAVYFAFYLANDADWNQFYSFWGSQAESVIWPYGYSCGEVWGAGGGHGVVCVGYDDSAAGTADDYWIMLNSWGSNSGRPNGLFRVPMYYDYDCADSTDDPNTAWYSIPVTFAGDAPATNITVTSPNGGEGWGTGSSQTITWTSSGVTGNVNIQLSRDGGATYTTIVSNTPNDGTQAWTVTTPVTTAARIKVISVSLPAVSDTSDANFTIAAPPAAPTLISPASGATNQSVTPTLDWNDPAGAVKYGVQVSAASTFATLLVDKSGLTTSTYTVAAGDGLAWNTTYYWRANAANSLGAASAWSTAFTFKTAIGPPPADPSGLVANPISSTRIDLAWTDNSDNETGFKIERKTGTGAFAQIATVGAGINSYSNISGLVANTTYIYRVRAYLGTTLNSAYSNEASATTLPLPPSAPTLLSPASGATNQNLTPTLDWNDPAGAVKYGVQVSTGSSFATMLVDRSGLTTSTYTVAAGDGLAWNKTYYWRANAANAFGSTSAWSSARAFKTAIGPPPADPSGLVANPVSSTRIDLAWTDNSDNESGFKIERKKVGGAFAQVATVGAGVTTYNNTSGLSANTQYYYRVRAYLVTTRKGATLDSGYSNEASATTLPLPPSAPTLISPANGAINMGLTPTLDWNDPAGAVKYGVQVSTVSYFTTLLVNESGLDTSTYTVPVGTLNSNTRYYWRANAANAFGGTSAWSAARYFSTAP